MIVYCVACLSVPLGRRVCLCGDRRGSVVVGRVGGCGRWTEPGRVAGR